MTWYPSESEIDRLRQMAVSVLSDTPSVLNRGEIEKAIEFSYNRKHPAEQRRFALADALATMNEPGRETEAWG